LKYSFTSTCYQIQSKLFFPIAYTNVSFHASFFFSIFLSLFFNPQFHPCYYSPAALPFFFLFLPLDLPICTLSVASFQFFSSSVPQPMFLVDSLSQIVLRSPKILLLFFFIPLRSNIVLLLLPSLSHLFSCVPLCVFFFRIPFPLSIFFLFTFSLYLIWPVRLFFFSPTSKKISSVSPLSHPI
jgi:hypothetical protein